MGSAPAALGSSPKRRRAGSAPINSRTKSASPRRAGSAPARVSASPNPRVRRAFSASPGVRRWAGPRSAARPASRRRGGAGRMAKAVTSLLALQGALMGRTAGGPYVGAPGKTIAVYPLGSVARYEPPTLSYPYGLLPAHAAVELKPRRPNPSRKMFLGGQIPRYMYEPELVYAPRTLAHPQITGRMKPIPKPVISARDVLLLSSAGHIFPKTVLKQATTGKPITGNHNIPNWAMTTTDPELVAFLGKINMNPKNRVGVPRQLALPGPIQRKLRQLETASVLGVARAVTLPYKIAAKARNVTGKVATKVGRMLMAPVHMGRSVAASVGQTRRASARRGSLVRRLPN